jgi:hypothetical protein
VSSASLALGCARARSLIQGIGGTLRSSVELVLGHMPSSPPTGDPGRSSVSISSSSSSSPAAATAMTARARSAREQVASPEPRSSSSRARSSATLSFERERQGTQLRSAHSFGSEGSRQQLQHDEETPPLPSILSQPVQSEGTTSGSTTTRTITLGQAMSEAPSQAQTQAHTPSGIPIPSSPSAHPESSPHPPGDLSTVPTSFVTVPPTIVSQTTDSRGDGRMQDMFVERGCWWYGTLRAAAHAGVHAFMPR